MTTPSVLHVTNAGGHGRVQRGGGERAVAELSRFFANECGWRVGIAGPAEFLSSLPADASIRRYQVEPHDMTPARVLMRQGGLHAAMLDFDPSIVSAHLLRGSLAGIIASRLRNNVRVVSNLHNSLSTTVPDRGRRHLRSYANLATFRLLGRLADAHIAISDSNYRDICLIDRIPPNKVHLIYNWVSREFTDDAMAPMQRVNSPVRIAFMGRLEHQKNPLLAVDVVSSLPRRSVLDVYGAGSLEEDMATHASNLGFADRIQFHGVTGDAPNALASADLVLVPSAFEGFGRVAVEALALGVPVVASDVGGLRDIANRLNTPGLKLVAGVNVASWVSAVEDTLSQVTSLDRTAMRQVVRDTFGFDQISQEYRRLFESVLSNPRRRLGRSGRR